jgi:hypothetical protein
MSAIAGAIPEDLKMVLRIDVVVPNRHREPTQPAGILLRSVFVALIVASTFAAAALLLPRATGGEVRIFDPRCEHLDIAATMRLAETMSDRSEAAQMQVRHGLMLLRRARRNCLYDGFVSARRDYEAIYASRAGS